MFVSKVSGRKGIYEVRLIDNNGSISFSNVRLIGDVKIRYGDLNRQPVRQVLKSYCTLNFVDETLELHQLIEPSFNIERFEVQISGPKVEWRGAIKEETRSIPFTNKISKETTQLRCVGGIISSRFNVNKKFRSSLNYRDRSYNIEEITAPLTFGDGCGERLRSDINLSRAHDGTQHRVCEATSGGGPTQPINLYINSNPYEAFKDWAKVTKGILYRSLTENDIIYETVRLVGLSDNESSVLGRDPQETTTEPKSRSEFTNYIDIENIIVSESSGLKDLEKSGKQIVNIGSERNILQRGAFETSTNQDTSENTSWELSKSSGKTGALFAGTDLSKRMDAFVGSDGNSDTLRLLLGEITPTDSDELGIAIEWDSNSSYNNGNPTVRIKYDGSTVASTSDISSDGVLVAPTKTSTFEPKIEIEGSNVVFRHKVVYINEDGKKVEDIKIEDNKQGSEVIEYDAPSSPLIVRGDVDTVEEAQRTKDITNGITSIQPWIFRAKMESETRPFGTKTLKGRIKGIYGPEWRHIVGNDRVFIATGLSCDLRKGITKVSLTEVPNHVGFP
jgi:hypothetical protein